MPGNKHRMHGLSSAHARGNGVSMQWKQWATDEAWSTPVHILSASDAAMLKRWHPAAARMEFPSAGAPILDWLGRLEAWCASQPAGSDYLGLHSEFTWLRAAVSHTLPGTYAPGKRVDDILRDLRALPHCRPEARAPGEQHRKFPQDIVAQLYPMPPTTTQRAPESPSLAQRAPESPREPQRAPESHREPQRTPESPREPQPESLRTCSHTSGMLSGSGWWVGG